MDQTLWLIIHFIFVLYLQFEDKSSFFWNILTRKKSVWDAVAFAECTVFIVSNFSFRQG